MSASFFDGFSSQEAARIRKAGTELTLPSGWSPIWEGTPSDKAYIILDGTVSVRRGGQEIATLAAGDIMGETSIVNKTLRNASVVTATDVRLLHLTREAITRLVDEIPRFGERLDDAVARHTPDRA